MEIACAGGLRKKPSLCEVLTKPLSRCRERSRLGDREVALEYAEACSEESYHPPKIAEENVVPLSIPEPTLLVVDQLCPPSDQENIPPHATSPPPLNILVPIMEEELIRVNDCCQRSLVVCSQTCIKSDGRRLSHPYRRPAQMQLASISKVIATLQDSCDQRQRRHRLERGLGGYESSSESGEDGSSDGGGFA